LKLSNISNRLKHLF